MKVYVLTIDQVYDFEVCDLAVEVYAHKIDAMKAMRNYACTDKENYALPNEWKIEEDIDAMYYRSFEDGRYAENHYEVVVHECSIQ